MLTNSDECSLVVDRLYDRTRGQHLAVTCFYFDFAARKEQTATSMLGSILKQVISGMERVPEDLWWALQEQKKAVCGRKPQLGDIVIILQLITSSKLTFIVIDALDECTAVERFRLFESLKEIPEKSPGSDIRDRKAPYSGRDRNASRWTGDMCICRSYEGRYHQLPSCQT